MLAANFSSVRNKFKNYCDQIYSNNETLIITRKDDKDVVLISLDRYNQMDKEIRNMQYLIKLARAEEQLRSGHVVAKTMDELEAMAE